MRIAIDARLNAYRRGGIPEYTRQLTMALAPLARADTFITLQHRQQQRPLVLAPNVQRRALFTPPHHRLEQLALPLELLPLRLDLLHSPDFVAPLRRPCPAVVTVHDLAFMRYPEILDDDARRYYGQVRESVHNAEGVIAVSRATRDDMVELLGLPTERIDVVYEAAAPQFTPLGPEDDIQREVAGEQLIAGTFGLFVSTLEPRKNLVTLFQALRICLDRNPTAGFRLLVAGAKGWRYQPIFDAVRDLRLENAVLFLGSPHASDLRWLYAACRFYANPSLYEGFGLPLLEAMACGAPCLASHTSSLPEIAGESALLLPPLEAEAWADAIDQVWHDDALRARLATAGPIQAARFSWRSTAEQTLAIYRRAAAERRVAPMAANGVAPQQAPPVEVVAAAESAPVEVVAAAVPEQVEVVAAAESAPVEVVAAAVPEQVEVVAAAESAPVEVVVPAIAIPAAALEIVLPVGEVVAEPAPVEMPATRTCLRCGAALEAGELLQGLVWQPEHAEAPARYVRAWACPACGSLDLELDTQVVQPTAVAPEPAAQPPARSRAQTTEPKKPNRTPRGKSR